MTFDVQESFARRQRAENRRSDLANQIRSLGNRQSHWNSEDRRQWDALNMKYDELALEDKRRKARFGRDDASLDGSAPRNSALFGGDGGALVDRALRGWAANALGKPVSPAAVDACEEYGLSINSSTFHVRLPLHGPTNGLRLFRNALSTELVTEGATTIPEGFMPRLERALLSYAGMMQAGEIITTESGNDLVWPTVNDTSNVGSLLGENVAAGDAGVDPKFGAVIFGAFLFTSNVVRCPVSLIEDTGVDLASALGDMMGERIGRALNPFLTTGAGGNQPQGVMQGAALGVTANGSTTIAFDDLHNLMSSVDPAYVTPEAAWMCHNSIWNIIKQLKDGIGRYLWSSGTQAGMPPTLLGHPVFLNQAMDSTVASGKKTVLFGRLDKYKVRRVREIRLRRLVERYAEFDQEGFIGFGRFDGALLDAGTHPIMYLQHP